MGLPASVATEPLVAPALSAVWMRLGERDHLAAGSQKPLHLQLGSAQEVVEPPRPLNTVGVDLGGHELSAKRNVGRQSFSTVWATSSAAL